MSLLLYLMATFKFALNQGISLVEKHICIIDEYATATVCCTFKDDLSVTRLSLFLATGEILT